MADDTLTVDEEPTAEGTETSADAAPNTDLAAKVDERFESFGNDLRQFGEQLVAGVRDALPKGQPETPNETQQPNESNEDFATRILSGDTSVVDERVDQRIKDALGPYLITKVNDDYISHTNEHRASFDSEYGTGKFDELIKPRMDPIMERMGEQKGSREHVQSVMRQIMGHEQVLPQLMEAKQEMAKNPPAPGPTLLDNGRPAPPKPQFTEDDAAFKEEYERETGLNIDMKFMEDLSKIRRKDGVLNASNFPKLRNRLEVTP